VPAANARLAKLRAERRSMDARITALDVEVPRLDEMIKRAKEALDAALGRRARGTGSEAEVSEARDAHAAATAAHDQAREEVKTLQSERDALQREDAEATRAAVATRNEVIDEIYKAIVAAIKSNAETVATTRLLYGVICATRDPGLGIVGRVVWGNVLEDVFEEPDEQEFVTMMDQLQKEIPTYQPPAP